MGYYKVNDVERKPQMEQSKIVLAQEGVLINNSIKIELPSGAINGGFVSLDGTINIYIEGDGWWANGRSSILLNPVTANGHVQVGSLLSGSTDNQKNGVQHSTNGQNDSNTENSNTGGETGVTGQENSQKINFTVGGIKTGETGCLSLNVDTGCQLGIPKWSRIMVKIPGESYKSFEQMEFFKQADGSCELFLNVSFDILTE